MEHGEPTLTSFGKYPPRAASRSASRLTSTNPSATAAPATANSEAATTGTLSPDGKTIYSCPPASVLPCTRSPLTAILSGLAETVKSTVSLWTIRGKAWRWLSASLPSPGPVQREPRHQGGEGSHRFKQDLLEQVYIESPEIVPFKARDGLQEYGWIMKPAGFKEGVKYPAVLQIGGPTRCTATGSSLSSSSS